MINYRHYKLRMRNAHEKCTSLIAMLLLIAMLRGGRLDPLVYSIDDGILYRRVIEGGQTFQAIYVPRTPPSLIQSILKAAHDDSGHNGFPRTYSAIRRLYYWKGIKEDVRQHCTSCYTFESRKPVRINRNLHTDRLHVVYTTQVQESIRSFKSLPATCILNTRWKHEDTY